MKKLILLVALLLPLGLTAQIPEPNKNTYVNDYASVLSVDQIYDLNVRLRGLELKTGVQFALVIINKLPDSISIEDYAREIGRKWHVGNFDSGIVYVIAISEHKQRLEVARHLEDKLTDLQCSDIMDGVKPFYKAGNYYNGFVNLTSSVSETLSSVKPVKRTNETHLAWLLFTVICAAAFILLFFRARYLRKKERFKEDYTPYRKKLDPNAHFGPIRTHSQAANQTTVFVQENNVIEPLGFYNSPSYDPPTDYGSSSSSSSSDFGNWGSDSGSNSFDSGFSGGGASSDW